jgi:hypothetical protein
MQVLNADGLVFATHPGGQLMQGIGPDVGHTGMQPSHAPLGFLTIRAAPVATM